MSEKLFHPVQEGHDPQGRPVFICKDASGFYVYKPATGFTGKHFKKQDDVALLEMFEYQKSCGHNNAFYRKGDGRKAPKTAKAAAHIPAPIEPKIPKAPKAVAEDLPVKDGEKSSSDKGEIYSV